MTRRLRFEYDILLEFGEPVKGHAFVLRCIPPDFPGQQILDVTLTLEPQVPYALQRDGFGNLLQIGRVEAPHERFRYTVCGTARLDASLRALRLPEAPEQRAWALAQAVRERMTYAPGETGVATTAAQAFASGRGVCQDFAHVYLALARLAGLGVRYVNGLPEGEGASHAWCEVWLDGRWTGIDPTRGRWTDESYLRFGVGRDFGDCPIERGVFLGRTEQRQTVFMRVSRQQ